MYESERAMAEYAGEKLAYKLCPFLKDERGNIAAAAVSFFVIIMFGALMIGQLSANTVGTDSATNATIASMKSSIWSYYALLVLIPLAMIFGAIMYYVSGGSK